MIKKLIILLIFLSVTTFAKSQLFHTNKGFCLSYIDIKNDSAYLEIFTYSPPDFYFKGIDTSLIISSSFNSGNNLQIIKRNNNPILRINKKIIFPFYKKGKLIKLLFKRSDSDYRLEYEKRTYYSQKRIYINKLNDSLSGPNVANNVYTHYDFERFMSDSISYVKCTSILDVFYDSLETTITSKPDPVVFQYYNASDSILQKDSVEIFKLLSGGRYKYSYSNYFIKKLSMVCPDMLIHYIDKQDPNKRKVLKAIKNHTDFKQIVSKVKKSNLNTRGKKEIIKQKRKRIISDVATATVGITIVLSEIALITFLVIWIF